MPLQIKRVYDEPDTSDGKRILVDRLWPRGISKTDAAIDEWIRECAPSNELRKWFAHDKTKWDEFKHKYFAELSNKKELLAPLRKLVRSSRVTLLFAASDSGHNNAIALVEYLTGKTSK